MCVCVVYVNVAPNSFGWDEFVVVVECTSVKISRTYCYLAFVRCVFVTKLFYDTIWGDPVYERTRDT